jgi:hypothetical protein
VRKKRFVAKKNVKKNTHPFAIRSKLSWICFFQNQKHVSIFFHIALCAPASRVDIGFLKGDFCSAGAQNASADVVPSIAGDGGFDPVRRGGTVLSMIVFVVFQTDPIYNQNRLV